MCFRRCFVDDVVSKYTFCVYELGRPVVTPRKLTPKKGHGVTRVHSSGNVTRLSLRLRGVEPEVNDLDSLSTCSKKHKLEFEKDDCDGEGDEKSVESSQKDSAGDVDKERCVSEASSKRARVEKEDDEKCDEESQEKPEHIVGEQGKCETLPLKERKDIASNPAVETAVENNAAEVPLTEIADGCNLARDVEGGNIERCRKRKRSTRKEAEVVQCGGGTFK